MFLLYFVIFIRLSIIKSTRRLLSKHFGHFHNFQVNFQFINNELITPTLIICSSTSDSAAWAFFFPLLLTHSSQPAVLQITEKVPALCSPHPRSPANVTLPVTQKNSESCSNKETIELMHTHTCTHTCTNCPSVSPAVELQTPPGHVDICTCRKLYRNTEITHMQSCHRGFEGLLWITAVYTSIHPGLFACQTSLECADYKAGCLWVCDGTSCVLCFLIAEPKKELIMSGKKNLIFPTPATPFARIRYSGHERKPPTVASFNFAEISDHFLTV